MKKINWKYTLGEVIIVIIGITIAFSLNSLKERISNSKLKKQYLENMVLDINKELEVLQKNEQEINAKMKMIKEIRPFLGNGSGGRDTIVRKVFQLARIVNFYPENTTYQTLINSGDMKLINNFALRRGIEEHYANHQLILQSYDRLKEVHKKYLADLFVYDVNYEDISNGDHSFLDKKILKNIITTVEGSYYLMKSENKKCEVSNKKLLEQIKSEL